MTVGELIIELQKYPEGKEVLVNGDILWIYEDDEKVELV